jgi:osmotically-inducible protein OsmY
MRPRCLYAAALALVILSFTLARAAVQQNPPAHDQQNPAASSQQTPASGSTEIEKNIRSAFNQDPNHTFRSVRVQDTDSAIILSGTVTTADAKQQAEQIANQYGGGKKVRNQIRVNPNVHPGPGL